MNAIYIIIYEKFPSFKAKYLRSDIILRYLKYFQCKYYVKYLLLLILKF